MADRRREYQVEVRLSVGGSWYHDTIQVDLPQSWGDTATRARFVEELTWFIRAATGPSSGSLATADARELQIRIRVPFEVAAKGREPGAARLDFSKALRRIFDQALGLKAPK